MVSMGSFKTMYLYGIVCPNTLAKARSLVVLITINQANIKKINSERIFL